MMTLKLMKQTTNVHIEGAPSEDVGELSASADNSTHRATQSLANMSIGDRCEHTEQVTEGEYGTQNMSFSRAMIQNVTVIHTAGGGISESTISGIPASIDKY
jgi:hypothetical protein